MRCINFDEFSKRELYVYDFYKNIIKYNDTVVDVGACHGLHTVPFVALVGPRGHVIAIEPQAEYADKIRGYQFKNGPKLDIIVAAADSSIGSVQFIEYEAAGKSCVKGYESRLDVGKEITVPTVTIDSLKVKPKFIKIDTEGYELNVLKGAVDTIAAARPYMSIETDDPDTVRQFLSCYDYDFIELDPYDLLVLPAGIEPA